MSERLRRLGLGLVAESAYIPRGFGCLTHQYRIVSRELAVTVTSTRRGVRSASCDAARLVRSALGSVVRSPLALHPGKITGREPKRRAISNRQVDE